MNPTVRSPDEVQRNPGGSSIHTQHHSRLLYCLRLTISGWLLRSFTENT